eukprot:5450747-Alexandrium_andersonii.AAC.1
MQPHIRSSVLGVAGRCLKQLLSHFRVARVSKSTLGHVGVIFWRFGAAWRSSVQLGVVWGSLEQIGT